MDKPNYKNFAKDKLKKYKFKLDSELDKYLPTILQNPRSPSGDKSVEIFKDYVTRGGKRLRGAFVYAGHALFDGKLPESEITKAAMAVEMLHAYILMVDDSTDDSELRRGKPSAHVMFRNFHEKSELLYDRDEYSKFMSVTAGLMGAHQSINLLLEIKADPKAVLRATHNLNSAIVKTAYGQFHDIYTSYLGQATEDDLLFIHKYKSALYTIQNPLQLGSILAGAIDDDLEKISEYAIPLGVAFQLQDDILGVFGNSEITGKPNIDDLAEGKMTLLIQYALKHGNNSQVKALKKVLHNPDMTEQEFNSAKQAIIDSGAYQYNKNKSNELVKQSKQAMLSNFPDKIENEAYKFIIGIADYMIDRDI